MLGGNLYFMKGCVSYHHLNSDILSTKMKITRLEAIPVRVPLKTDRIAITAHGRHAVSEYVILKMHTDEGLIGLGEATVQALWSGETAQTCVGLLQNQITEIVVGKDPNDIQKIMADLNHHVKFNPFTKACIEMALWDILGKARNLPLYELLGGKCHDKIPMKMMIGGFDPKQAAKLAETFLEWGVGCLKVKVGLVPKEDLERVEAVRAVAGMELPMTIDSNCGWSAPVARKILPQFERFQLILIEQPTRSGDWATMSELRRISPAPLMADENVWTLVEAYQAAAHQAVDIISVYPGKNGGIMNAKKIAHVAHSADMGCHIGSNLELGIASAAMLHLAASTPEIESHKYPADILGPCYHETDLLAEPLQIGPKFAVVPDKPGLGVELDDQLLKRYRMD
jgi:muconate cycloisomerase